MINLRKIFGIKNKINTQETSITSGFVMPTLDTYAALHLPGYTGLSSSNIQNLFNWSGECQLRTINDNLKFSNLHTFDRTEITLNNIDFDQYDYKLFIPNNKIIISPSDTYLHVIQYFDITDGQSNHIKNIIKFNNSYIMGNRYILLDCNNDKLIVNSCYSSNSDLNINEFGGSFIHYLSLINYILKKAENIYISVSTDIQIDQNWDEICDYLLQIRDISNMSNYIREFRKVEFFIDNISISGQGASNIRLNLEFTEIMILCNEFINRLESLIDDVKVDLLIENNKLTFSIHG